MATPPFSGLFVTRVGSKVATGQTLGAARGRINLNRDRSLPVVDATGALTPSFYSEDCELWRLDAHGWTLIMEGKAGERHKPW